MIRTAPLLGTGCPRSGAPTPPRPSCRSRRVPCAGLSCQRDARSWSGLLWGCGVETTLRGPDAPNAPLTVPCALVGGPGPLEVAVPPGLRFHVVRPWAVAGAVERLPVVDTHTGADGAASARGVTAWTGAGEVDHSPRSRMSASSSGLSASGMLSNMDAVPVT